MNNWLLDEVMLGGSDSPQYLSSTGEAAEGPSYIVSESYLQSYSRPADSSSKLENVTSMNCPGGSWMSQLDSISFGYLSGNPGEVIVPLGAVSVSIGTWHWSPNQSGLHVQVPIVLSISNP